MSADPRLEGLHCDGCARRCPLTAPSCRNGRRRTEEVLAGGPVERPRRLFDSIEDYVRSKQGGAGR